ncbi:hypothetical protein [Algoriphagus sp.]|jgi:type I restriction enzyme R subunit|nr:hypothetical protein [Algoriphagus sp.]MDO8967630.1 hypothetical protein [Algoriphagus sp.]MDP3198569.1 hypothetical protein [Algoriphagus sp.]
MNKLIEDHIEKLAIAELDKLGYAFFYAPDIAPDADRPERESFGQVLLER